MSRILGEFAKKTFTKPQELQIFKEKGHSSHTNANISGKTSFPLINSSNSENLFPADALCAAQDHVFLVSLNNFENSSSNPIKTAAFLQQSVGNRRFLEEIRGFLDNSCRISCKSTFFLQFLRFFAFSSQ